jgi:hypothetical protein
MPLICYVHRQGNSVPYFEVLSEPAGEAAARRAAQLLAERPDGVRAELWDGEELVLSLEAVR